LTELLKLEDKHFAFGLGSFEGEHIPPKSSNSRWDISNPNMQNRTPGFSCGQARNIPSSGESPETIEYKADFLFP
jgi:hypothetical protein